MLKPWVEHDETCDSTIEVIPRGAGTGLAGGAVGQRTNNGILQYLTVERRGNYLVPPRRHRALPSPHPEGSG